MSMAQGQDQREQLLRFERAVPVLVQLLEVLEALGGKALAQDILAKPFGEVGDHAFHVPAVLLQRVEQILDLLRVRKDPQGVIHSLCAFRPQLVIRTGGVARQLLKNVWGQHRPHLVDGCPVLPQKAQQLLDALLAFREPHAFLSLLSILGLHERHDHHEANKVSKLAFGNDSIALGVEDVDELLGMLFGQVKLLCLHHIQNYRQQLLWLQHSAGISIKILKVVVALSRKFVGEQHIQKLPRQEGDNISDLVHSLLQRCH
mmetsp:Transcript_29382/g.84462  ORF Transcript_29382/g.84462 Transcript_29382/m.84462 type:complete len:260 (-) Transcript_29382:1912-2691(-)